MFYRQLSLHYWFIFQVIYFSSDLFLNELFFKGIRYEYHQVAKGLPVDHGRYINIDTVKSLGVAPQ